MRIYVVILYKNTERRSMVLGKQVGLGGCWITKRLLAYCSIATGHHKMVRLECWIIEVSDYRGYTVHENIQRSRSLTPD